MHGNMNVKYVVIRRCVRATLSSGPQNFTNKYTGIILYTYPNTISKVIVCCINTKSKKKKKKLNFIIHTVDILMYRL